MSARSCSAGDSDGNRPHLRCDRSRTHGTPADWQPTYVSPTRAATNDPRFSRLSRMLTEASNRITVADEVQRSLRAIVDYRLQRDHAVDRTTQPDEARALLGPDLFNYLNRPARQRGSDAKHLTRLLTRIEAL